MNWKAKERVMLAKLAVLAIGVATPGFLLAQPQAAPAVAQEQAAPRVRLEPEPAQHRLRVLIDGQEAIVYRYGPKQDLVHYYPVRSPSGKSMTVEHPKMYPHHRSFWFADRVRLEGHRVADFYNGFYSKDTNSTSGTLFKDHIRHVKFLRLESHGNHALVVSRLRWEMDHTVPVLDELRTLRITALGHGEYFLDLTFVLTANYGKVEFMSDAVHYAWPYIRMNQNFNVLQGGGRIVNSAGQVNRAGTNGKVALWVDYSHGKGDEAEGLAMFIHPDNPRPHRWLTRDYGTFGPRRVDAHSGKRFFLDRGKSMTWRVGVLVHRGDVKGGKVAERYQAYADGKLGVW